MEGDRKNEQNPNRLDGAVALRGIASVVRRRDDRKPAMVDHISPKIVFYLINSTIRRAEGRASLRHEIASDVFRGLR